jgi:hypothetical protein
MKLHSGEGPINAAPGAFGSRHRVTGIITDIAVLLSHCEPTDLVLGGNTCGEKVAEKKNMNQRACGSSNRHESRRSSTTVVQLIEIQHF